MWLIRAEIQPSFASLPDLTIFKNLIEIRARHRDSGSVSFLQVRKYLGQNFREEVMKMKSVPGIGGIFREDCGRRCGTRGGARTLWKRTKW